jgi:hypothetical protein
MTKAPTPATAPAVNIELEIKDAPDSANVFSTASMVTLVLLAHVVFDKSVAVALKVISAHYPGVSYVLAALRANGLHYTKHFLDHRRSRLGC